MPAIKEATGCKHMKIPAYTLEVGKRVNKKVSKIYKKWATEKGYRENIMQQSGGGG